MAEDRWLRRQAEMAGTADGPSIGTVLTMLMVMAAVLLALLGGPAAVAEHGPSGADSPPSLCEEHPHWSVCQKERTSTSR